MTTTTPTTLDRVREQIKASILPEINTTTITRDTARDTLNMDSLDDLSFVMSIEEEFGLEITDDDCAKWRTVGDICAYLDRRVEGSGQ